MLPNQKPSQRNTVSKKKDDSDEAPHTSPKRSRRGSNNSSSTTGGDALLTPVRNAEESEQHTPKSDFKNFAENMGGSPLQFGLLGGLFSPTPSLSGVPFTPGSSTTTALGMGMSMEEGGGGVSSRECVTIPTSRDWSPLCNSSTFDFEGSSASSSTHPHLMDKMFHTFRGGGGRNHSSSDQSPAEYISSATHGWGDQLLPSSSSSSPMGVLSFPSAPLSSSSSSEAHQAPWNAHHMYPHHQSPGGSTAGSELQPTRRSNDLFSANAITASRRHPRNKGYSSSDDKKRKLTSSDAVFLSEHDVVEQNNAPPSPGIDAIAAAARELESQGSRGRRRGTDKKPPLTAPSSSLGQGLLKGVVGRLSYSTSSEGGDEVPCMSFTAGDHPSSNNNSNSNSSSLTSTSSPIGINGSVSHTQKSGLKLFPYLPQKATSDEETITKKTIKAEIQTYTQGNDTAIRHNSDSWSGSLSGDRHYDLEEACSPKLFALAGQQGVPDISPATKFASAPPATTCNCKKSKCLKLYCDCFRVQRYCDGCHCTDCSNLKKFDSERQRAVAAITERNPEAFKPRITLGGSVEDSARGGGGAGQHLQGCHCKKSACLKKYCECFQAEVPCHDRCRCQECKNTPAAREAKRLAAGVSVRGGSLDRGGAGLTGFGRTASSPPFGAGATSSSVLMLKTYDDPPLTGGSDAGGVAAEMPKQPPLLTSSHLDLKAALLSPSPSSRDKHQTPGSGSSSLNGSTPQEQDDLRPIYNKAQAEQAALEIVSAFLRGELTVPGQEYLSTKASAMRHYSSPPPRALSRDITISHRNINSTKLDTSNRSTQDVDQEEHEQQAALALAAATASSLPLMEKLSDFEEARQQLIDGARKDSPTAVSMLESVRGGQE